MIEERTIQASAATARNRARLVPLRLNHAYPRANPGSVYWRLAPYLIEQMTSSSCGLATMAMILNGASAMSDNLSLGALTTERRLLDLLDEEALRQAIVPQTGGGLSLSDFARHMNRALDLYGIADRWRATTMALSDPEEGAGSFREALTRMEAGDGFIAVNFHLDRLYGDGTDVGHFSPLGGFDEGQDRVLVLDVYKPDYEPMWAPVPRLVEAMAATSARTGERRGFALIERLG